jgi:hypothetical protein
MMYPYVTLADETEVVHSHLIGIDEDKSVEVYFERAKPYGFDSARITLPTYKWIKRDGFSDEEIVRFEDFTARHAHLLFRNAAEGGHGFAEAI